MDLGSGRTKEKAERIPRKIAKKGRETGDKWSWAVSVLEARSRCQGGWRDVRGKGG